MLFFCSGTALFCNDLMEGLELNPATRIMWKSVKPLLMGQILYAPDSPAVRQIIKNVSQAFDLLYTDCLRTCVGWRGKQPTASAIIYFFFFFWWKQFAHVISVGVDTCWSNPLEGQQSRMAWLQKRNRADCGGYHNADWRQFLQCYVSCAALPLKMWSGTKRDTFVIPLWPNHLDPLYSALLLRLGP